MLGQRGSSSLLNILEKSKGRKEFTNTSPTELFTEEDEGEAA